VHAEITQIQKIDRVRVPRVPEALALFEITFFAGLRKAGMPEE
jgi:hypothetical protein